MHRRWRRQTSTAEVMYGAPLRVPGMCFQDTQTPRRTVQDQLELARSNAAAFLPSTLDLRKFKEFPFVSKPLRTSQFVFVRDDRLGKPSLAPRYTGPYRVLAKNWENNTFTIDMGKQEDVVSLTRFEGGQHASGDNGTSLLRGGMLRRATMQERSNE